ncbi:hypothetical protein D3C85_1481640 [compost metagenome]
MEQSSCYAAGGFRQVQLTTGPERPEWYFRRRLARELVGAEMWLGEVICGKSDHHPLMKKRGRSRVFSWLARYQKKPSGLTS